MPGPCACASFAAHHAGPVAVASSSLACAAQVSDWNRRPLSDAQLRYAALDAAVQLPIYEALRTRRGVAAEDVSALCFDWWTPRRRKGTARGVSRSRRRGWDGDDGDNGGGQGGGKGEGRGRSSEASNGHLPTSSRAPLSSSGVSEAGASRPSDRAAACISAGGADYAVATPDMQSVASAHTSGTSSLLFDANPEPWEVTSFGISQDLRLSVSYLAAYLPALSMAAEAPALSACHLQRSEVPVTPGVCRTSQLRTAWHKLQSPAQLQDSQRALEAVTGAQHLPGRHRAGRCQPGQLSASAVRAGCCAGLHQLRECGRLCVSSSTQWTDPQVFLRLESWFSSCIANSWLAAKPPRSSAFRHTSRPALRCAAAAIRRGTCSRIMR
jgi:3'-5' exonuclease